MNYNSYTIKLVGDTDSTPARVENACFIDISEAGVLMVYREDPMSGEHGGNRLEKAYAPGQWLSFEIIAA